mgnify:CR=1 FL=1
MSTESEGLSRDDPRLNEIIAQYLLAVEAGESPDPEQLLREHPEYAEELRQFLADKRQVDAIAGAVNEDSGSPQAPVQNPLDVPTLPPENTAVDAPTLAPSAAAKTAPKPGAILRYFGDYELLAEIARGGMGVVYKARQVKLNRVVAIKMILAGQLASQEDVQRFYTEAEAAAGLDHPGIVPIYEVGEHEGQHYFSMGFVDGDSLSRKIADRPLSPRDAAFLLHKIAQAVQYAHDQGYLRSRNVRNMVQDDRDDPGRTRPVSSHHTPLSLL